jgi:glycosidase
VRAPKHLALPSVLIALAACADVHPAMYDAGALSPATPPADGAAPIATNDAGLDATVAGDAGAPPPPVPLPDGGAVTPLPSTPDTWLAQVIYLVIPDRFTNGDPSNDAAVAGCLDAGDPKAIHGGDFAGLRARIPYLRDLGVTAVWVTPAYLQAASRCSYHGYWADFTDPDDGALAPNLGSAGDLALLVGDLHAAGIRFVLDMVVNHAGIGARAVAQHPGWFHDPTTCKSLGDPNVYCPVGGKPLPDFAQENGAVAAYLSRVSVGWAARFGVDAVRMDTVKNVLPSYWASSWFPAMRAASPGLFVVGEDFDESGASALKPYLDDGFDSLFDYPRYAALVATFAKGGSVDGVASAVADAIATYGMDRALRMTSFADNHDNPRMTSLVPAGTSDADTAGRFRLALGAIVTLPGIPQIMWGDEVAMLGAADPDNRRDMPAWAWDAKARAGAHAGDSVGDGQAQYAFVQKLLATRAAHTALQKGSYAELWRQNGGPANVLAFFRGDGSDRVIVAINPGTAATVALPIAASHQLSAGDKAAMPDGTSFQELLGAGAPASATIAGGALSLAMPAQSIGVYAIQ